MKDTIFKPKPLSYYEDLTDGGDFQVSLNKLEASIALKVHDYGVDQLNDDEKQLLYSLIGKLKDQVWP